MRRLFLLFSFILLSGTAFSQFKCPPGFHLVRGDNGEGDDDVYTNGKCGFDTHKLFRDYDFKGNNNDVRKYMSDFFRFPFYLTKDGLCWGTGQHVGDYCYVVVSFDGDVVELFSKNNDSTFSYYSKWLLNMARQYKKAHKSMIFPMHSEM